MSPTAQPETVTQFEEWLQTEIDSPEKFGIAYADTSEKGFKARLKAYIGAKNKERTDIVGQIEETTKATVVEMYRNGVFGSKTDVAAVNKLDLRPGQNVGAQIMARGQKNVVGAKLNGQFENFGQYIQTIWHNRTNGKYRIKGESAGDLDKKLALVNEYGTQVPDAGGFLVPEEYRAQLFMLELEGSIAMPRATVVPMSTQTLIFPTVDATSNATSTFGGVVVYRTQEGEEFVESQAKFGRVKLDATKQTALAYIHNETIRDSAPAIMSVIGGMLPQAMAFSGDIDFHTGTGAGEPLGALATQNPALLAIAKETGQDADTIVWKNVLRMYARMLPQSLGSAIWEVSPDAFVELATMALNVGTGGSAVWITNGTDAPVLTLLGRPVVMTEKVPGVLGDQGDINFVDWRHYLVGVRENLTVDTSDHVKFTSDQTTVRAIARNDGRPWLNSAITPHNGGDSLSPFITLAERA